MKNLTLEKIKSIFKSKKASEQDQQPRKVHAMQLKLFLLQAALKHIQKGDSKKPLSLFTTKILSSKSKHLDALVRHAELVSSKGDIELFSYKEFFCRNQFALRRAVQWKMAKYVRTQDEATQLIKKMQESTPESFRKHLVTLLEGEGLTSEEITREAKRLEEDWCIYQKGQGSRAPTSRIAPI